MGSDVSVPLEHVPPPPRRVRTAPPPPRTPLVIDPSDFSFAPARTALPPPPAPIETLTPDVLAAVDARVKRSVALNQAFDGQAKPLLPVLGMPVLVEPHEYAFGRDGTSVYFLRGTSLTLLQLYLRAFLMAYARFCRPVSEDDIYRVKNDYYEVELRIKKSVYPMPF